MRSILLILFILPAICFSQKQETFIKLTNSSGKQVNGLSVKRGFERWINAVSFSTAGRNNSEITFTMPVSNASVELKAIANSKDALSKGQVTVSKIDLQRMTTLYTINMEQMKVMSCSDFTAAGNTMMTSVTIQATRIGWTYYAQDRMGKITISGKYGYDLSTGDNWTGF